MTAADTQRLRRALEQTARMAHNATRAYEALSRGLEQQDEWRVLSASLTLGHELEQLSVWLMRASAESMAAGIQSPPEGLWS